MQVIPATDVPSVKRATPLTKARRKGELRELLRREELETLPRSNIGRRLIQLNPQAWDDADAARTVMLRV